MLDCRNHVVFYVFPVPQNVIKFHEVDALEQLCLGSSGDILFGVVQFEGSQFWIDDPKEKISSDIDLNIVLSQSDRVREFYELEAIRKTIK